MARTAEQIKEREALLASFLEAEKRVGIKAIRSGCEMKANQYSNFKKDGYLGQGVVDRSKIWLSELGVWPPKIPAEEITNEMNGRLDTEECIQEIAEVLGRAIYRMRDKSDSKVRRLEVLDDLLKITSSTINHLHTRIQVEEGSRMESQD